MAVTTGLDSWDYQNNYVERIMDNSAYTAAHPDDTLVLVGPPRFAGLSADRTVTAVGMLQAFQVSQQRPTVPLQSIGSGRSFFVSGKSSIQFQIGRLFVKGKNLMRALYHNAQQSGVDFSAFNEPAVGSGEWTDPLRGGDKDAHFVANLDSELFLIPFGLQVEFRDKSSNTIGGFYIELAMINSYSIGVNAGQNMILENVSGLADRIVPLPSSASQAENLPDGSEHPSSKDIDGLIFP
jgi:hypothetical protein